MTAVISQMSRKNEYVVIITSPDGVESVPVSTINGMLSTLADGLKVTTRPVPPYHELRIVQNGSPVSHPTIEECVRTPGPHDNPKVFLATILKDYRALIAQEPINIGEKIAVFDGVVYTGNHSSCAKLPNEGPEHFGRHAIQIGQRTWRDSNGIARYANHSCRPNCGIIDEGTIIAMESIEKGKEITWAYWMTEDPDEEDLNIPCLCSAPECLGTITGFRRVPLAVRNRYKHYISDYLKSRYYPELIF